MSKRNIDMLNGGILKKLCLIALPLALSSTLQQLFNAADVAVVGQFSSSQAMAAVGSNAPVINMIVTLFVGLAVGANVVIAGFIGSGRQDKVSEAVHTCFTLALICGVIMLALGMIIARPVLEMLNTPDDVIDLATLYLRIYFLGMPFVMVYNFGSAILRSVGDTRRPLYCLTVAGVVNVFLNLFFVIVCHMSADGVGLATTISNGISAGLVFRILLREQGMLHLDLRKLSLKKEYLGKVLRIGGPAGLQGLIFSFSNVVIQAAINYFGSACIAGNSAALNFEYIAYFIVSSYAQAVMTFISQNYAAGKFHRCRRVAWITMVSSVGVTACVSVTFYLLRYPLLALFTSDPEVVRFAVLRMTFIMLLEPMTSLYEIPGACLRGIGDSMLPAIISLIGCCGLRVAYIYLIFGHLERFEQVGIIYPITWVVTGAAMITAYFVITRKKLHRTAEAAVL